MVRPTPTQKLTLALRLLVGMQRPGLQQALASSGFNEQVLESGWRLFITAAQTRPLEKSETSKSSPNARLTAFQQKWLALTRIALRTNLGPEGAEAIFPSLPVRRRAASALQVTYFIARIRDLEKSKSETERRAREMLRIRGLTDEVLEEAEQLVEESSAVIDLADRAYGPINGPALDALWKWCSGWQEVTRRAVTNKTLLLSLGLLEPARSKARECKPAVRVFGPRSPIPSQKRLERENPHEEDMEQEG